MPTVLTICADCERHALRRSNEGKAITEALSHLIRLLMDRKRLRGLEVHRGVCLQNCPMGKICVVLKRDAGEVRHHFSPDDDLEAVAAKLAGTARG